MLCQLQDIINLKLQSNVNYIFIGFRVFYSNWLGGVSSHLERDIMKVMAIFSEVICYGHLSDQIASEKGKCLSDKNNAKQESKSQRDQTDIGLYGDKQLYCPTKY